jgi:hypothetical protein
MLRKIRTRKRHTHTHRQKYKWPEPDLLSGIPFEVDVYVEHVYDSRTQLLTRFDDDGVEAPLEHGALVKRKVTPICARGIRVTPNAPVRVGAV